MVRWWWWWWWWSGGLVWGGTSCLAAIADRNFLRRQQVLISQGSPRQAQWRPTTISDLRINMQRHVQPIDVDGQFSALNHPSRAGRLIGSSEPRRSPHQLMRPMLPSHLISRCSRKALPILVWVQVRPVMSILCRSITLPRLLNASFESTKSTGPIITYERSTNAEGNSTSATSLRVNVLEDRQAPKISTVSFARP